MTQFEAYDAYCNLVYQMLLSNCPVDTGNMITHIRYNNDGTECRITIDTIPYSKAGKSVMRKMRKRQHTKTPKEVEYAAYTEYPWVSPHWHGRKNPNESWIRRDSLYEAATKIADSVRCEIEL